MTAEEAYYKFLIKINKNSTNFNATVDKSIFCSLYNEAQRRWLNKNTPERDGDAIANVQSIIVGKLLNPLNTTTEYVEFELPKDWFSSADCYVLANKGACKKKIINLYQVRSINVRKLMSDDSSHPSFEFEESFYTVENNKIKAYKGDFTITKLSFNYYKEPENISLEGIINIDGSTSINKDPELADIFVDQIISEAATEYMRNWENPQGVQLAKDRQNSEN